ncbi:DUF3427 domain-containing protein [Albimonas pacifica]|uniref:Superfamily II DNA or RNA helicase n=1 Tax=Albimonas pacifica TaxID=1114924 RepID=A0A1I3LLJ2_9RHOB|nr:DUF3427 domain-containing protein [Albimonas pacifica]SFI85591.1 Superfamily II DNA or RNA helicase [Albimonas pacifica]
MTPACPICAASLETLAHLDAGSMTLRAEGEVLLAPRRHVAGWRALTTEEQTALALRLAAAQDLAEAEAEASGLARTVFVETGPHFHIRISAEPERAPETEPAPVSTRGPALLDGPQAALLPHLAPHLDEAAEVDAAVAFALRSGVDLLFPYLEELLERGGRLRLLVGDYLGASDPTALRRLLDLPPAADLRIFDASAVAFHPKSWLFRFRDGTGALLVGSSNLSRSALDGGVEWTLRLFGAPDAPALVEARDAFARLMARPEVAPLTHDWIDAYEARRIPPTPQAAGIEVEPPAEAPAPHEIQAEALDALAASRARGHRSGLVVLATGLGKTFLAAFDSRPFARVLFVAHREEILTQAMAAFRAVRPGSRLGRFAGGRKDREADVLFASIQTLGRAAHLSGFDPGAFDYVVVDEFHHAAAATYRRVIEHFEPAFLLGLTATPERADGGDLLSLCGENLVYRCDMWDAIGRGRLCPFTYHGLPDDLDYTQIPWRGRRFDEAALTEATATRARARDALDQLAAKGGARTLGFCVSQRHADFMARFAREAGLRAKAVHAGPGSAPRTASLAELQAGELDILFAVDMFNEGVDVPQIDTVLMLRPTESPVVWLQQFGRGLRLAEGKDRLQVIDYIGAHRSFLVKARALLQVTGGDRALAARLSELRTGALELPPGCEIAYDTVAIDLLERLLRVDSGDAAELAAFYEDFRLTHGARPTAREVEHAGFDPRRTGHGLWFDYVRDQGDLTPAAQRALQGFGGLLREIETGAASGGAAMPALAAMIDEGAFPGEVALPRLAARLGRLAARAPRLARDLGVAPGDAEAAAAALRDTALAPWTQAEDGRWFALDGAGFRTRFAPPADEAEALRELASELVDWRLARRLAGAEDRAFPTPEPEALAAAEGDAPGFARPDAAAEPAPEPWREYMRDEIPPLFGDVFSDARWNVGIVPVKARRALILLVTLKKGTLATGNHYEDRFLDPQRFRWASQTSTTRHGSRGRILSGAEPGWSIHLFVRGGKSRNGKAAPFRYCGPVAFEGWEGEAPIYVDWRLPAPVPDHLRTVLGVPEG